MNSEAPKTIGIIPAAGKANRLGKLPFSKELYPVGFDLSDTKKNPKTVSQYLLEGLSSAGVTEFHFVLRTGKWDIPAYYGSGSQYGYKICYHIADYEYGVPFTVNQAYHFIKDKNVVLGFPDILLRPNNVYKKLLKKLFQEKETSIVLGLFPTQRTDKYDMVLFDKNKKITDIIIKQSKQDNLKYAWVIAAWKPDFSEYIKSFVDDKLKTVSEKKLISNEYHMGDVICEAIESGMHVQGIIFNKGEFLDVGTPEDLRVASIF